MSIRSAQRILSMTLAAAALVFTGTLSGCAGFWQPVNNSSTNSNTGTGFDLVYAGKNNSNSFVGYAIGSTGLTAVTGSPFGLTAAPVSMAITPADTFLYVATSSGIYGYSIAAGGALSTLSGGSALASPGTLPVAMDISPDGAYLAVMNNTIPASASQSAIFFYPINASTGLLGTVVSVVTTGLGSYGTGIVHNIKFSPIYSTSQYLLAASYGTGGETIYTFSPANPVPIVAVTGCNPPSSTVSDNNVGFNAAGTSLIVLRGGSSTSILSYTITASSGVFSCSETTNPTSTGNNPTTLSFNNASTSQPYLYVTNQQDNTISGYGVNNNSTVPVTTFSALGTQPYTTSGTSPDAIAFDNSGLYMLVMTQYGPPDLIQYTVDTTLATAGRLYVTGSVNTGLGNVATATNPDSGITMVTTH
jgi:6-phosphogluconolactonase